MAHQFFQGFFPPQEQIRSNRTQVMDHNEMVFEIQNNWESLKDLLQKIKDEKIETVNILERDWLNFINSNGINIDIFKNEEDFVEKNLKPLVNEK